MKKVRWGPEVRIWRGHRIVWGGGLLRSTIRETKECQKKHNKPGLGEVAIVILEILLCHESFLMGDF